MSELLNHLGSIWYHSEPSDVPYSENLPRPISWFGLFLKQNDSKRDMFLLDIENCIVIERIIVDTFFGFLIGTSLQCCLGMSLHTFLGTFLGILMGTSWQLVLGTLIQCSLGIFLGTSWQTSLGTWKQSR